MNKKIWASILIGVLALSLAACGGKEEKEAAASSANAPAAVAESTESGSNTAVSEAGKEQEAVTAQSGAEAVKVLYGTDFYGNYEFMVNCPEGAYFEENHVESYKEDGYVFSLTVYDDEREYVANVTDYHAMDYYEGEWGNEYGLPERLYFYGELDADYASQFEDYSQSVSDLGFRWDGKDVILVETAYTYPGYGEQFEVFVGVEYEFEYWKAKQDGGIEEHLKAPGLFGFTMYSTSFDDLTQDQCAWIAGQLFGVDSGRSWPLDGEGEGAAAQEAVSVKADEILGSWVDPESDWGDTYTFKEDYTGFLVSGPEYPFTYEINGSTLTLIYAPDDTEDIEISVDGDVLTMIDKWGEEYKLERTAELEAQEASGSAAQETADLAGQLIATWKDDSKFQETFIFNADETGLYAYDEDGVHYEFAFTYWIASDSDVININYEDGDRATFYVEVKGDSLILDKDWELKRQ